VYRSTIFWNFPYLQTLDPGSVYSPSLKTYEVSSIIPRYEFIYAVELI